MKNMCSLPLNPTAATRAVHRPRAGLRRLGRFLLPALCIGFSVRLAADDGSPARYQQTNLISDVPALAAATDASLVNPWGLARSATSPWWIALNGTGLATLSNGMGVIQALVVTVPGLPGATGPAAPTGTVFNGTATDFLLSAGTPAHFLFVTEEGTISGWNAGTSAVLVVNNSSTAVYKGLTIASSLGANFLYAANFKAGTVDVFDHAFKPVTLGTGAFQDPQLPKGYAPFNVQSVGASIYVTFAQTEAGSIDEVHGPGKGFVDVFSPTGVLQKRLQSGTWFNAPWGVALAPASFGRFSNLILVGQFGSGKIAAFDPVSGNFRGFMTDAKERPLIIDGLWALGFGNGATAGPINTLFFTAGLDDEAHGLFGTLTPLADDDDDDLVEVEVPGNPATPGTQDNHGTGGNQGTSGNSGPGDGGGQDSGSSHKGKG
jgi:uncharacterized protein (TIGR03118 family)